MHREKVRAPKVLGRTRRQKRARKEKWAVVFSGFVTIIIGSAAVLIWYFLIQEYLRNREKPQNPYPINPNLTVLDIDNISDVILPKLERQAHISDEFAKWEIPEATQKSLYKAVQRSPINPKTGRHCIMYSITNEGMIHFTLNMYCSMMAVGIPRNYHVMVALDEPAYRAMKEVGAQVVYLQSNFTTVAVNNKNIVDYYDILKMKPTILHQLLLWDAEAILVDADVVFLENPLSIFNDDADFEVQCDSKEYYWIPVEVDPVVWQVNLGFFKTRPSSVVKELFVPWLERMYRTATINEQSALRRLLKPLPTRWMNSDTVIVETEELFPTEQNVTFRFLDPMYICNAGGIYKEGRRGWKWEARRRGIRKPWVIHYFHIGYISSKLGAMVDNDMWFVQADRKCVKEQTRMCREWPLWKKPMNWKIVIPISISGTICVFCSMFIIFMGWCGCDCL